jgi:cytochrome c-type biogenesis protein CcmF
MKIHPPIIFAGFAALTVPFAYAIAALWRNEYHEFAVRVRPWAIYSATMLGFGLALGGYWAYETLGWGGFWAWDPVENSSYFPWLFMAAGMHGLTAADSIAGGWCAGTRCCSRCRTCCSYTALS